MPLAGLEGELEAALVKLKSWHPSAQEGALAQAWIDWLDKVSDPLIGHRSDHLISVGMVSDTLLRQRKFGAVCSITHTTPETLSIH